ncbi:MAG: calcium/sodium antiporter [Candidatus Latescibacteria bacterium]|nr:calcium/sodium antiporter [Candidatus Latescibacterota bacterium]
MNTWIVLLLAGVGVWVSWQGGAAIGFWPALGLMAISFVILAKSADWLVDGAIEIAQKLHAPPILIGIVIVGIGTTAPELAVSVTAALQDKAGMALGNAVGSVIYDDGLALPLAILLAPVPILIEKRVLKAAAIFLIVIDLLAYAMAWDGVLSRGNGLVLVGCFVGYLLYTYWDQKRSPKPLDLEEAEEGAGTLGMTLFFVGGLVGVLASSHWIVQATPAVGRQLGIPDEVVALVLVALGTSIPEVATCIIAARKGAGSLAVGNILGADILNICWIAGASAVANPLKVSTDVINFMFPAMLIVVLSMLALMFHGYKLEKWKGGVLLGLCAAYLVAVYVFNPGAIQVH